MRPYEARVGDHYYLRVSLETGREYHAGRASKPGLVQGIGVLEVTVKVVEPDGTVVEATWTRNTSRRVQRGCCWERVWEPVAPHGQGWIQDRRAKSYGSTGWVRRRQHEVLVPDSQEEEEAIWTN